ncbi:MAG: hypothetical protein KJP07_00620 [Desulfatitalea sp.]|nr:hypothetical protein [Desulfatitalea sp.]
MRIKKNGLLTLGIMATLFLFPTVIVAGSAAAGTCKNSEYGFWKSIGKIAAIKAMKNTEAKRRAGEFIALTNAGYAEVDGRTTQAALDGLSKILAVSRGDFSLVEIHSNPVAPLWFAVYARSTGICAYLEVAEAAVAGATRLSKTSVSSLFSTQTQRVITADTLFENPYEAIADFDAKIFNGNEFRIVTITNAVLAGAPPYVIRSTELHDHFCPGVTSGVFLARYLNNKFPIDRGGSYFVQSVRPWCKEDALLAILNTTPGKKGYHLYYPTDEDQARWVDEAKDAANIIYRKNPGDDTWDGIVVAVGLGQTDCPAYNNSLLDKLCSDLYHLKNLDVPEDYITVIKSFTLPVAVTPKDYARPGVDPMVALGLVRTDSGN